MMKPEAELRELLADLDLVIGNKGGYGMAPPFLRGLREMVGWVLNAPASGQELDPGVADLREKAFQTLRDSAAHIRRGRRQAQTS